MLVNITKDYWNGTRSKATTTNLDGLNMSSLAFMLMEPGVAGITITQVESLQKIIEKANKPAPQQATEEATK